MADVEMKEAAIEPAAKGKGTAKAEGSNDGKKRFEVKKVSLRHLIQSWLR